MSGFAGHIAEAQTLRQRSVESCIHPMEVSTPQTGDGGVGFRAGLSGSADCIGKILHAA